MKNFLLILLFLPIIGFGQGWETVFGGSSNDFARSVQQTTDGGYIITGLTNQFLAGDDDVYLIKTDGNGVQLWSQTFGGANQDEGYSVQQTTDGGYIITGQALSFGNGSSESYLIKTDGNGVQLWSQTFGGYGSGSYSIQQTTDGGYVITGTIFGNGGYDIYLSKTDGNGVQLWSQTFGTGGYNEGYSVQQTTDGGYVITGVKNQFGAGDDDVYLIKTDGNGVQLWSQTFGGTYDDSGLSVQQTTDGGYIITGSTESFGNGGSDIYLIKTDGNGNSLWIKTIGGISNDYGCSVQQTTDGGYIITGSTSSIGNGGYDAYLIKTDGNGVQLWSQTFGGTYEDAGLSVQQTTDGGYIISGYTRSFGNGSSDVYLIKTDGNGNVTSTFNIPTLSSNRELKKIVDMLGREINPKKNKPFIEIYDDGGVEKRIVIE